MPLRRAVTLGVVTAAASRSVLASSVGWLVVLAAVYAADAGPPLPAMAFTAAALFPIAAWATGAQLAATSDAVRAVLTAADGRLRVLLADALPPLLWIAAASLLGVAASLLLDPHRPGPGTLLLGTSLHLLCGAVGGALGLLLHARRVSAGVRAVLVVLLALGSARLAWLPPAGPVLREWGGDRAADPAGAAWALVGPVVVVLALLASTERLRRRRC